MTTKPFNELKQGDTFRFTWDPENVVRTAQQIGKTEIYCPRDGDNTMGHSKGGGEEVYAKSEKEVIMIYMTDVKITIKNMPLEASLMFEVAFKKAAQTAFGAPLEIPAEGLLIDFNDVKEQQLLADLINAMNIFTMAHSWIALTKRRDSQ